MVKCKICGSQESKLAGKPRKNQSFPKIDLYDYEIRQCKNCSFYFISPQLNLSQIEWEELYNRDYFTPHHLSEWKNNTMHKEREQRLNLISKHVNIKKGQFLDVGCGEGFVLKLALAKGFEVFGLDIADNLHQSIEKDKIHFFKGNIFDAKYPENKFSAIYIDSVLEHVDDPISILKEINRILKPGGAVILMLPNEDSLINSAKKLLYTFMLKKQNFSRIKPFMPPYHINGFNKKSLKYAIESTGFKIIKMDQFGGDYKFWKAYKLFSKNYIQEMILFPIGLLSIVLNKQYQFQVIFTK